MKKTLLLTSLLLALTATVALAGGVNLTWATNCYTENPVQLSTFACNTNTLTRNISLSFAVDNEIADMAGVEITLIGQTADPTIPAFWHLETGGCRAGRMSFSSNKEAVVSDLCQSWNGGVAFDVFGPFPGQDYTVSGTSGIVVENSPQNERFAAGAAIPADAPFDMVPGVEYYAGGFQILGNKIVGATGCAGCLIPMVIESRLVVAAGVAGYREALTNALPGGNKLIYWQNLVTPTQNSTWGAVKSLYR